MSKFELIGSVGSELADRLNAASGSSVGMLLDLSSASDDDMLEAKQSNRPVVLAGNDAGKMASIAGVGASCDGAVWHPGTGGADAAGAAGGGTGEDGG